MPERPPRPAGSLPPSPRSPSHRPPSHRPPVVVTLDGFTADGLGTGTSPTGQRWILRGGVPGSIVAAIGRSKAGLVREVLSPAPDAVPAPCSAFGLCGGCQWQTFPLLRQREEKEKALRSLLAPLGGTVAPLLGAPDGFRYRNKMEFSFGNARYLSAEDLDAGMDRNGNWLGLHAPGRFDRVVDVRDCHLLSERANVAYAAIRERCLATPWPAWDPHQHAGFWRHLLIREGREGLLAWLYTASATPEQAEWLRREAPTFPVDGFRWYENDAKGDAVGGEVRLSIGRETVRETLGGVPFELSPAAFFQVNPEGAELLVEVVRRLAGEGKLLLDLYCGTGALGLALSPGFSQVFGVELNESAVAAARQNAAAAGIAATFLSGAVESVLGALPGSPDVVIVDPPRAGLHPRALSFVAEIPAKVLIYVACRPTSLLRDAAALVMAGWRCTDWQAVDLFPQTGHVEVVARFERGT